MMNKQYKLFCFIIILGLQILMAQIPDGYYSNAEGLSGNALRNALHNIIDDHSEYSYDALRDYILKNSDEDPNNSNNIILLYTGRSQPKSSFGAGSNDWNREHVWAKSHGDFGNNPPCGTDAHHLRPTDSSVNSSRGNKDFDNGGTPHSEATGCNTDTDSWEPRDEVKGDVARMILYMDVRYEGDNGEPDLVAVDYVNSSPNKEPRHGKLSTLLEWHLEDPPDNFEIHRNDVVYSYQNNRNPFIDHPEYVGMIWGDGPQMPSNIQFSNLTQNSVTLAWNDNSNNESGFNLYQNSDLIQTLNPNTTSIQIDNLEPNTKYLFGLSAFNNDGESAKITIEITTLPAPPLTYTIMSYNIQNYGEEPSEDTDRKDDLRNIINSVDPDILVVEEIWGNSGNQDFLDNILNYEETLYNSAFIDQFCWQDIGLYYKTEHLTVNSIQTIDIATDYLRDALKVNFTEDEHSTSFNVYSLHLKANTSDNIQDDIDTRASQTAALRNYLNTLDEDSYFLVVGDFNILNASESGWQNLTNSENENTGRVFDPINQVGEWNSNQNFAPYHTHSTRYSSSYPNSSGLRTRLDFILTSEQVLLPGGMEFIEDSYITYGNDGNHFGDAVNYQTNSAVSSEIADALYNASDHLPVYADFRFTRTLENAENLFFSEYIEGSVYNKALEIYNGSQQDVCLDGYQIISNFNGNSWNEENYSFPAGQILGQENVWVVANSQAETEILNNADDILPNNQAGYVVGFNGNDVRALVKIDGIDTTFLDFIGNFNGIDPGDGWSVAGIEDATKDHTLIKKTGVLRGNTDWLVSAGDSEENSEWLVFEKDYFSNLGFHNNDVDIIPESHNEILEGFKLLSNFPNPFNPETNIEFSIQKPANIKISVFNIKGQHIKTLINKNFQSGLHRITWNGTNSSNCRVVSGIYFYQMTTEDGFSQTKKMILLQ